jgi:N utilization substance protein B
VPARVCAAPCRALGYLMKHRRQARELALQVLYACEMVPDNEPKELTKHLADEHALEGETLRYGRTLIDTVLEKKAEIDEVLKRHSANWDIRRMAATDRNVLRIAAAELLFLPDIPYRVVIDEAVEVAKLYGTDDSGKFVNGVIDAVYRAHSKPPVSP